VTITGALLVLAAATATCPRPAVAAAGLVLLGVVNVDEIREYLHGRGRGEAGYLSERDLLVLAGVLLLAALIVAGAVGLVLLLLAG
jgi:hypothetical protein